MRIVSLASGSGGNAYVVEGGGSVLLIDCGICFSTLRNRSAQVGVDLSRLCGVLVTHEHTDHTKGLAVFHKRLPDVPLFANLMTAEVVERDGGVVFGCCFENGQPFDLGPFTVEPFSVPHDVSDPVGFTISVDGATYFHATDIGAPLASIGGRLARADAATLEFNHDPQLLRMSARPEKLKSRIRGPRGHLSNDEAAQLVRSYAPERLRYLALAHLSSECNAPHLAECAAREALREAGRREVCLEILSQDEPSRGWEC